MVANLFERYRDPATEISHKKIRVDVQTLVAGTISDNEALLLWVKRELTTVLSLTEVVRFLSPLSISGCRQSLDQHAVAASDIATTADKEIDLQLHVPRRNPQGPQNGQAAENNRRNRSRGQ